MINEKIKLRYEALLARYGNIIGKKEYAEIFKISRSSIDKYIAMGGINLAPYKKHVTNKLNIESDVKSKHNNSKVYWDTLDIAIQLEHNCM